MANKALAAIRHCIRSADRRIRFVSIRVPLLPSADLQTGVHLLIKTGFKTSGALCLESSPRTLIRSEQLIVSQLTLRAL